MSQENVVAALAVVDAVARMDEADLVELTHPEVEWHSFFAPLGEGGAYRGHAGIHDYVRDLRDAWDGIGAEVEDTLAVGDIVIVVSQLRYRGKGSGVDAQSPAGYVFEFRAGKIIRMRSFRDPEAALAAVGLRE